MGKGEGNGKGSFAIGLDIGIPVGLALIGGIIFVGLQLRKWATATQKRTVNGQEDDNEKTVSVGGGGGNLPLGELSGSGRAKMG
ncbi:hypothetical protein PGQ11_006235 [Apiospora arundinis]|uniref:Uncharacterized protein n=1 Tax=Apiospora arundinis TaxID=335852 RepID=A0ABR2ISR4_9PEZI